MGRLFWGGGGEREMVSFFGGGLGGFWVGEGDGEEGEITVGVEERG